MKIRDLYKLIFVFVIAFVLIRCEYEKIVPVVPPEIKKDVYFNQDISPVIKKNNCSGCHPSAAGIDLSENVAYSNILDKKLVNLDKPQESVFYQRLLSSHYGIDLSASDKNIILEWIKQGAIEDISGKPTDNKNDIDYSLGDTLGVVSFSNTILPIFVDKCMGCHNVGASVDISESIAYQTIIENKYTDLLKPENSILYKIFNDGNSHRNKLSKEEMNKIYQWIKQGALNN